MSYNQIMMYRPNLFRDSLPLTRPWVLCALFLVYGSSLHAQTTTDLSELRFSADIDTALPGAVGDVYGSDGAIIIFDVGSGTATYANDLGALDQAQIDAFHRSGDGCGNSIYSLDTTVTVASTSMRPADVFDAAGTKILDANSAGIPAGINIDAVSREPGTCDLLLSVDTAAMLGGSAYRNNDIIRWNSGAGFSLYQSTGFPANIDALHLLAANLMLVSIDVGAALPDMDAMDDEVFEISTAGGGFQLIAFEPALLNNTWQGADVNALWAMPAPLVGTVQWQSSSVSVLENTGLVNLAITRINGSSGAISVNWSTTNGSATSGSDFTAASGSLPMSDGQSSAQIAITLLDDALVEGLEFFTIQIDSTTGGAAIGSPAQIQINIIDDEDYVFSDGFE